MQNPRRKNCDGVLFQWNCRDKLWWKSIRQGGLPMNIFITLYSVLLQEGLMLCDKIEGYVQQGCIFIKAPPLTFFLKLLFLMQLVFGACSKKESVVSSLYSKVAAWTLQPCNFTLRNSITDVFLEISKILQSSFLVIPSSNHDVIVVVWFHRIFSEEIFLTQFITYFFSFCFQNYLF